MAKRIYVAGPYTKPDPCANTHRAVQIANDLLVLGFVPYVPHLSLLWHVITPKPYQEWLDYDAAWIPVCDALLRFDGESSGADKEVEIAKGLGLPVFYSIAELQAYQGWELA